jgi:hypothetical protein
MSRVTDTPPEVEQLVRERIMAHSGEERFIMGSRMFDSAREMMKASLPNGLSRAEEQRLLFNRIYGKEIDLGDRDEPDVG